MHLEMGSEVMWPGLGYSGKIDFVLVFKMLKDLSLIIQVILWSQFSLVWGLGYVFFDGRRSLPIRAFKKCIRADFQQLEI